MEISDNHRRSIETTFWMLDELHLKLHGYEIDVGRAFQGRAALFTEYIEELQEKRLDGFGKPSSELVAYLDPKLAEFDQHLTRIQNIGM